MTEQLIYTIHLQLKANASRESVHSTWLDGDKATRYCEALNRAHGHDCTYRIEKIYLAVQKHPWHRGLRIVHHPKASGYREVT